MRSAECGVRSAECGVRNEYVERKESQVLLNQMIFVIIPPTKHTKETKHMAELLNPEECYAINSI